MTGQSHHIPALYRRDLILMISGLLFALSGCRSPAPQTRAVNSNYIPTPMLLARCDKMIKNNQFDKKTAVSYHRCVYDVKSTNGRYYSDIDKASDLKRIALSEDFASGRITASQFNSLIADYELQIKNIELSRRAQEDAASAAAKAAESVAESAAHAADDAAATRRAIDRLNNSNSSEANYLQSQIDQIREETRATRVNNCRKNATSLMGQSACM